MLISTILPRISWMHWQTDDTWDHTYTLDEYVAKLKTETPDLLNAYDKYKKEKVDSEGNTVKDSDGALYMNMIQRLWKRWCQG